MLWKNNPDLLPDVCDSEFFLVAFLGMFGLCLLILLEGFGRRFRRFFLHGVERVGKGLFP